MLEEGFTREVRNMSRYGTGDFEISTHNQADLVKVLPLLQESYEAS